MSLSFPYTTGTKYGIFGKLSENTHIGHFDLLKMAWHQPQTSIMTLMQLSHIVLWAEMLLLPQPPISVDCTKTCVVMLFCLRIILFVDISLAMFNDIVVSAKYYSTLSTARGVLTNTRQLSVVRTVSDHHLGCQDNSRHMYITKKLRPKQNDSYFADDILKSIFLKDF